jgi:hypothetical protein
MQAPTATALFSLPDDLDGSELRAPYLTDRPLAQTEEPDRVVLDDGCPDGRLQVDLGKVPKPTIRCD